MPMQTLWDIYHKYRFYLTLSSRFAWLSHHIVTSIYTIIEILQNSIDFLNCFYNTIIGVYGTVAATSEMEVFWWVLMAESR